MHSTTKTRFQSPFAYMLSALTAVILLTGCDEPQKITNEELLRPVRTFVVGSELAIQQRSFPGVVDANQKAMLSFRVSGKLEALAVKEGDEVTKGQVLAQLNDEDFRIQLAEARASYKRAKSDLDRGKQLVGKGHVSKADYDKISSSEASARAHLDATQQKITYSTLKAPFAGLIAKRYVENYQEVGASQSVFLLQDLSLLEVAVDIPSSIMVNAERDRGNLNITARFDAIEDKSFPLQVREVSTVADEVTQTYAVKLSMQNVAGYTILPGMTATVTAANKLAQSEQVDGYIIPSHSVVGMGTEAYVWLVTSKDNRGTVSKQKVVVGEAHPNGLEIMSGLSRDQLIVTAGMSKLVEGQEVRLKKGQLK